MLRQLRSLYAKANRITRMFHYCTVDVKLLLIKSYCTSFYCGYLWSDYKASTFSKLRVAFNNVYRLVLGLPQWSSASGMYATHQGWGQVQLTKYSSTTSTSNIYQVQVLVKYSFFKKVLKYIKYFHIKYKYKYKYKYSY